MNSFSHANNIVMRRDINIHSLPGVKLIKLFSLANETQCVVTVPPFDFVKDDCAVGNAILDRKHNNVFFDDVHNVAGGIYYNKKRVSNYCIFMACADRKKLLHVTKDETTLYFIQFAIKGKVCKVEFYCKHSAET